PPKPKASRARCLRFAPLRPRWTYRFRHPSLARMRMPIHRWWARDGRGEPATGSHTLPPSRRAPVARGRRAGTKAAWTAGRGNWRRISDAPDRPPLPAPRLETLDQTPLGTGRDDRNIVHGRNG